MKKAEIIKNGNVNIKNVKQKGKEPETFFSGWDNVIKNIELPERNKSAGKIALDNFEFTFNKVLKEVVLDEDYSEKERANVLFTIKNICLIAGVKRPKWFYQVRNKINWINEDGSLVFEEIDLGGF